MGDVCPLRVTVQSRGVHLFQSYAQELHIDPCTNDYRLDVTKLFLTELVDLHNLDYIQSVVMLVLPIYILFHQKKWGDRHHLALYYFLYLYVLLFLPVCEILLD